MPKPPWGLSRPMLGSRASVLLSKLVINSTEPVFGGRVDQLESWRVDLTPSYFLKTKNFTFGTRVESSHTVSAFVLLIGQTLGGTLPP